MSTLATSIFGLRSTFTAAFASLNQCMMREFNRHQEQLRLLSHILRLTTFLLSMVLLVIRIYTYLQNKRMRRCGVAPPPIIFERLKLPQQIIYRRKENLSESPNHKKYWENILVSRFYKQFSRNRRNLGHFRKFEKISNS